ncbi:MAG TPA: TonB-dependent receptor [Candidatus Dormibacteraeota bacterium]|nr:TonB-dependent receptor [Candidatus Dormibacteraeota bacterium]
MTKTTGRFCSFLFASCLCCCFTLLLSPGLFPQQTLGGITGTVTDTSGGAIIDSQVTLVAEATKLTRTQKTNNVGSYEFVNLAIGTYSLTFTHDGFQTLKIPSVPVQADRTATVNATLKVGLVGTTVTVEAAPLMNAEDTTNGYILETGQIESVPLSTGSFTSLAILSPGVNAELPSGTGANSGLGNQPIWANGQRDTSNSFLLNGVDASNLFNGKSTSQVASARVVNNTGVSGAASSSAAIIQSTASPYLAIGQALPTPATDSIQELRVNTSMYDAQQGSTSGAHIDMSTASGTNALHGSASVKRGTNALNAAPFFFNADPNIPSSEKNPELHRVELGGTLGGALIKDKLFGFISYQHIHSSDQEIGLSRITVPAGLTNDRSPAGLAAAVNGNFPATVNPVVDNTPGDISPVAYALLNYKLPSGQYLIPSADGQTPTVNFPENAIVPGTALFTAHQAVADLDWNATAKDTVALKYYYQHDPTIAPYAYSSVAGFAQHLDAGSQVFSIGNTQTLRSNLSISETFGFIREKVYSTISQPFGPSAIPFGSSSVGIDTFGSTIFPGITIVDPFGNTASYNSGCSGPISSTPNCADPAPVANAALTIGQGSASQGAFTGVFQNRFMPSATAIWTKGKHTITFGGSYAYTQLDTRDRRTDTGNIGVVDFSQFLLGLVTPYTSNGFVTSAYLQGDANRYYRAGQNGLYIQDKYQLRSNLNVTLGLRYDWNGGLTEKYGRIYNFDPSKYAFDGNEVTSTGFIIAGNNKQFPTKGVSNSTLTGRQWGLAPRLGIAWSPQMFHNKIVVRAGTGLYYDRGELFSYFSPGFAAGVITGGPFGVNQSPPFVNSQVCQSLTTPYQGYIPTCDPSQLGTGPGITGLGGSLAHPWGNSPQAPPTGNPADIISYLPTVSGIEAGLPLFPIAVYDRKNKLPYTINNTLDIQWQPRNDLLIQIGYVGNLGRHLVIPVPFNQAQIASPSHPINGQYYSYGYTLQDSSNTFNFIGLPSIPGHPSVSPGNYLATYEGGNVDMRVPYVGYSSESLSYEASGISAYNALQTHVEKRLSHGLQVGFSYTWSHATDEQSGLGLFYNGNNPLNLRDAYGTSDFDRTHVFNFNFSYQLPKFAADATSIKGRVIDGWALEGVGIYQSGQPFSVVDYTGAVGSLFYGVNDGINNPVVPLKAGCTLKQAAPGASGATPGVTALYAPCFTIPILQPGDLNGAIPMNDPYETNFTTGQRNIFRQSWQRRLDVSFVKDTSITERTNLKFSFDVFNVTNTPSFDIPIDDVSQNQYYNGFPTVGTGQPVLPSGCGTKNPVNGFYNCPFGLGNVNKTIGSARQIQMALRLTF